MIHIHQDLIDYILIRDYWLGTYQGIVDMLLSIQESEQKVEWYLHTYVDVPLGNRFRYRLWQSRDHYEKALLVEKRLNEMYERAKEREEEHNNNPIIIELRNAIASEDFNQVLAIKNMLRKAGGYSEGNMTIQELIKKHKPTE